MNAKPEAKPKEGARARKPETNDTIRHGSKDQEIENIKRLLAHLSQRVDALKTR